MIGPKLNLVYIEGVGQGSLTANQTKAALPTACPTEVWVSSGNRPGWLGISIGCKTAWMSHKDLHAFADFLADCKKSFPIPTTTTNEVKDPTGKVVATFSSAPGQTFTITTK